MSPNSPTAEHYEQRYRKLYAAVSARAQKGPLLPELCRAAADIQAHLIGKPKAAAILEMQLRNPNFDFAANVMTHLITAHVSSAIAPKARRSLVAPYRAALEALRRDLRSASKANSRKLLSPKRGVHHLAATAILDAANAEQIQRLLVPDVDASGVRYVEELEDAGSPFNRFRQEARLPDLITLRTRREYMAASRSIVLYARNVRRQITLGTDTVALFALRFVGHALRVFAPPRVEPVLTHCASCHRHVRVAIRSIGPARNRAHYCARHATIMNGAQRSYAEHRRASRARTVFEQRVTKIMMGLRTELASVSRALKKQYVETSRYWCAVEDCAGALRKRHESKRGEPPWHNLGLAEFERYNDLFLHRAMKKIGKLQQRSPDPKWGHLKFLGFATSAGISAGIPPTDLHAEIVWPNFAQALLESLTSLTDIAPPLARETATLGDGRRWSEFLEAWYAQNDDPVAAAAVSRAKALLGNPDVEAAAPPALLHPFWFLEDFVRRCETIRIQTSRRSPGRPKTTLNLSAISQLHRKGWSASKIAEHLSTPNQSIGRETIRKAVASMSVKSTNRATAKGNP